MVPPDLPMRGESGLCDSRAPDYSVKFLSTLVGRVLRRGAHSFSKTFNLRYGRLVCPCFPPPSDWLFAGFLRDRFGARRFLTKGGSLTSPPGSLPLSRCSGIPDEFPSVWRAAGRFRHSAHTFAVALGSPPLKLAVSWPRRISLIKLGTLSFLLRF